MYPNPEEFLPSRWLDPSFPTYREPLTQYPNLQGFSQFGFGRRTCQGVPIVEQDLFLTIGGMAWAFTIQKKVDPATGKQIPVHWNDYTSLLIAKPCKFDFDAVPRDEHRMAEMKSMFDGAREAEREKNEELEMDISEFEKDLGAERIYRDVETEVTRIKEDAKAEQREREREKEREQQERQDSSISDGSERGGYSISEPSLEFRYSSSEADTDEIDEDGEATLVNLSPLDGSLVELKGEIEPPVNVLEVPGAWRWS
jgi:Cytochrome P450